MIPDDLPGHTYLRDHRPEWRKGMVTLRAEGWPWWCAACGTVSFLCYRCSVCGRDLSEVGNA